MGGHIVTVTQCGIKYTGYKWHFKKFPDPPGHLGGVHPAPGVGPRQGQTQESILEQNSSN